jgi:hypothetical protein
MSRHAPRNIAIDRRAGRDNRQRLAEIAIPSETARFGEPTLRFLFARVSRRGFSSSHRGARARCGAGA